MRSQLNFKAIKSINNLELTYQKYNYPNKILRSNPKNEKKQTDEFTENSPYILRKKIRI